VRSGGNLGRKTQGGGAHREAEVAAMRLPIGGVVRSPMPERGLMSLQRVKGE
jgi:hypothetical protein